MASYFRLGYSANFCFTFCSFFFCSSNECSSKYACISGAFSGFSATFSCSFFKAALLSKPVCI